MLSPFQRASDPEEYFNRENWIRWGLAHEWKDESEWVQREALDRIRYRLKTVNETLRSRFGTTDGNTVAAREIVDDILLNPRPAYD
jgi:hypothetical protein